MVCNAVSVNGLKPNSQGVSIMGKYYVSAVATVALCLLLSQASYSASWVESSHGGMSIPPSSGMGRCVGESRGRSI